MASGTKAVWGLAEVVETEQVAEHVRRVVLAPDDPVPARPGSHVDVRLAAQVEGAPRTLTRSYSVVRSEDDGRRLSLGVQLAAASRGGSVAMHALRPGDRIAVTKPLQDFPLGVGAARYVLLAGGVGLTAVMAMADALRARGADYRLVVAGRGRAALPYLTQVQRQHGEALELHLDDENTPLDVTQLVAAVAADPRAGRSELYMCGPIGLLEAVKAAWSLVGLPRANLRFETFGSSGSWPAQSLLVSIPRLGREVEVRAGATILETLEQQGIDVLSDCRRGECGLCVVKILELQGRVDHRDVFLDDAQKAAEDQLCVCVSRVVTGRSDGAGSPARICVELP